MPVFRPIILPIILSIVTVLAISLSGMGVSYAFGREITLVIDGQPSTVSVVHASVAEVLASQNITLNSRDKVTPDLSSLVDDETVIKVEYARAIDLTYNGQRGIYWTHATTVSGVLDRLGLATTSMKLSAPLDTAIPREGMALTIATAADVKSGRCRRILGKNNSGCGGNVF